ncbi:unnamed protein product, partial [Discosporangium mesarthrocarpum]
MAQLGKPTTFIQPSEETDMAHPRGSKRNRDVDQFPLHMKRRRIWHRLGYVGVNIVILTLIFAVRGTMLWDSTGTTLDRDVLLILILALVFEFAGFFSIQGSDPGYLSKGWQAAAVVSLATGTVGG